MWLRLRQICLVARELEPQIAALQAIFGLEICHRDPGVAVFGLENALLPVGNQFLEVVAPVKPDTAAERYLARRGGDGGYMVITQCDEHAPRKRRVAELGVRQAWGYERPEYHCMQLHPKDTGGAFFEMDWQVDGEMEDGPWTPAGPDWKPARRTDVVSAIRAAELQSPDPDTLAARWGDIAELPVERDAAGQATLTLQNATLRFVECSDGRPEGLGGLDLAVVDRPRVLEAAAARGARVSDDLIHVCGTRFWLVD